MGELIRSALPPRIRRILGNTWQNIRLLKQRWPAIYTNIVLSLRFRKQPPKSTRGTILYASHVVRTGVDSLFAQIEVLSAKHLELAHDMRPVFFFDDKARFDKSLYRFLGFRDFIFGTDVVLRDRTPEETRWLADAHNLDIQQIGALTLESVPIGRLTITSARRALKKSWLHTPDDREFLLKMLDEALVMFIMADTVFTSVAPDIVVVNHPPYFEMGGIFLQLAISRGITAVALQAARVDDVSVRVYSEAVRSELVTGLSPEEWQSLNASPDRSRFISEARRYVEARMAGEHSVGPRQPRIGTKHQTLGANDIAFADNDKPLVGVFTHLNWDASGYFYTDVYNDYHDWVAGTARAAVKNDKVNWVFRVHPAEATNYTAERSSDIIREIVPADTPHVRVIESTEPVSSYALAAAVTAGITVRGTLATELPCMGVRMICAGIGETVVGSYNQFPRSIEEYEQMLLNLPDGIEPLTEAQIEEALLVAYGHFIYRVVQFDCIDDITDLRALRKLRPQAIVQDAGLRRLADIVLRPLRQNGQ